MTIDLTAAETPQAAIRRISLQMEYEQDMLSREPRLSVWPGRETSSGVGRSLRELRLLVLQRQLDQKISELVGGHDELVWSGQEDSCGAGTC